MKKVILLMLLMPWPVFGQIVQNFEPESINSWVQSPESRWKADTAGSLSGRFSLHHFFDNPDAGTDCVGLPLQGFYPAEGDAEWTFTLWHGYDPSSLNKWLVLLMSDKDPDYFSSDDDLNGFAVGVNHTGSDDTLRLSKIKEGVISTVVNTGINWQSVIGSLNPVRIVVRRSSTGMWTIEVSWVSGGIIGSSLGTDPELFNPGWFGIRYTYSSTRDRLLWFDDLVIDGVFHEDKTPPEISQVLVSGKNTLDFTLNEKPSDDFLKLLNFSLTGEGNVPVSISKKNGFNFHIVFRDDFPNKKPLHLEIGSLCDIFGNCAVNPGFDFALFSPEPGDVVITEIMADPFPEVSLPGKEYIEIKNRTGYPINLSRWRLSGRDQGGTFPETIIDSAGYMIVCSVYDTSLFSGYGKVAGIKGFPVLTDGGTLLHLTDSLGSFIHGVEYSTGMYGDELRSGGGWSIEMTDTDYPFYFKGNWKASKSRSGGTPGLVNSNDGKNTDNEFYGIVNVFPSDSLNILVTFSEPVIDTASIHEKLRIGKKNIISVHPADPLFRKFLVRLPEILDGHRTYEIDFVEGIMDFAGNTMRNYLFVFGLPESSVKGDILFNELLFNSLPGDPDYIEFYNISGKIIDVERLQIVSVDDQTADTSQLITLSNEPRCFMPGAYYAVTTYRDKVLGRYSSSDPAGIFELASLPSMNDDEGHLVLYNRELDLIDEVRYTEEMHYQLLDVNEGVALEKTSPQNDSMEALSWHSASESSGWGTPGAPNSVYTLLPETLDKVVLSSSKITPDGDGNEDNLVIGLQLEGNDNIVSVMIFDETGRFVKKVVSNMLTGVEATLMWDGTADDGSPVKTGIYIILISIYDDKGKNEKIKKICTVIKR